ncbi:unnamed protein product [Cyprideis torosa]|uniref:Uncharacterized protein n=1 Tax=Cyprideis torosa TaxID=163714 RepID=A0A7R8WJ19_9CRUS|nr:unnamed protein product [Cyprideis torosa]CAG0901471.1 unnamed protein product [Cyprideis torosa]
MDYFGCLERAPSSPCLVKIRTALPQHLMFYFLLLDICVVAVTKAAARRRRPPVNVDDMFFTVSLDRFSFPSGHCTRSFSLAFIAYDRSPDSYILCTLLFIWATLVSSSRVALGRHHVGDILGGVVIAYVQSLLMVQLFWLSPETAVWIGSSFFGDEGTGIHDSQEL